MLTTFARAAFKRDDCWTIFCAITARRRIAYALQKAQDQNFDIYAAYAIFARLIASYTSQIFLMPGSYYFYVY